MDVPITVNNGLPSKLILRKDKDGNEVKVKGVPWYPADLKRHAGVIVGDDVRKLFEYARKEKFAIPAINVTSTSTIVAALEAAQDAKAPIILQVSSGGAEFLGGKGLKRGEEELLETSQEVMIRGSIGAAQFIRSVAPFYGIPVVLHTDHCHQEDLPWLDGLIEANIEHNAAYQARVRALKAYREELLEKTLASLQQKDKDEKEVEVLKKKITALQNGIKAVEEEISAGLKEPLFSSHMIDLSKLSNEENIRETKNRLIKSKEAGTWLEMEIGITGGEEDGVNNEKADRKKLYTNPQDIWDVYSELEKVSSNFSIAAAFGNVHGLYKPGAVKLRPWLLGKHQKYVKAKKQNPDGDIPGAIVPDEPDDMNPEEVGGKEDPKTKNPVFFVFHGGSGSAKEEFLSGIEHGVVKVNIDTDTQFTYTKPVRDWMVTNADRLELPVGTKANPNGEPNKSKFDPRKWLREAEKSMGKRVAKALEDFNAAGKWNVEWVTEEEAKQKAETRK